jgi:hypothetical protein
LAKLTKKRREKIRSNKIRGWKTGYHNKGQWNSEDCLGNTLKILINMKMDKYLDVYDQPKLNQEDRNFLNWSIRSNEIEAIIKSLQQTQVKGPDEFPAKFY